jgi:hypothetical protein
MKADDWAAINRAPYIFVLILGRRQQKKGKHLMSSGKRGGKARIVQQVSPMVPLYDSNL